MENLNKRRISAATRQIRAFMKKRAETDPSLPYLSRFSLTDDVDADTTVLKLGDVFSLYTENEKNPGFVNTLGYANVVSCINYLFTLADKLVTSYVYIYSSYSYADWAFVWGIIQC